MNIKDLTLEELVYAEKAATIVRRKYEDIANTTYQGRTISENDTAFKEYRESSQKLSYFNSLRLKIIQEMENRLTDD